MKIKRSFGERAFDTANLITLLGMCALVLIPFLHLIAGSLSETSALFQGRVSIWPVGLNFDNYERVFNNKTFWGSLWMSVKVVVVATTVNMFMTILTAYPLSKTHLHGRKAIMLFVIFTMIFSAPLIPSYLVVKALGLLNTIWALVIPSAISAFNMILCITFFRSLPEELFEAAKVDGMSEYRIVWQIAVPLSMPILVTLLLYYSVGHWNSYFGPLLYLTDRSMHTVQVYLYYLISQSTMSDSVTESFDISPEGLKSATIIVATIPIILIYPFIQKHFIKGALLGSLKE